MAVDSTAAGHRAWRRAGLCLRGPLGGGIQPLRPELHPGGGLPLRARHAALDELC